MVILLILLGLLVVKYAAAAKQQAEIYSYHPIQNATFMAAIPFNETEWNRVNSLSEYSDNNSKQFIIVIPYVRSILSGNLALNRALSSWKEYANIHQYIIRLMDMTPILQTHRQPIITATEKRHGSIYVTGKPLIALYAFRKIAADLLKEGQAAPRDNRHSWMVFVDLYTMVANPYFKLEDLVRYSVGLTQQHSKYVFDSRHVSNRNSRFAHPHSNVTATTHTTSYIVTNTSTNSSLSSTITSINTREFHGEDISRMSSCHLIGQLSPTQLNTGFLLFPFTTTAHGILQDWAYHMHISCQRGNNPQEPETVLQTLILRHLQGVLDREYASSHHRQASPLDQHRQLLVPKPRVKTQFAKHPVHMKHRDHSDAHEHQLYRERKGDELKQQFRQKQQHQQEVSRINIDEMNDEEASVQDQTNNDADEADAGFVVVNNQNGNEFNVWSLVFGGGKAAASSPRTSTASSATNHKQPNTSHIGHNQKSTPQKPHLPYGSCTAVHGKAQSHQHPQEPLYCFTRTMREFDVYRDSSRILPFCLLAGQTPISIFNVYNWPKEREEVLDHQYSVFVAPASPFAIHNVTQQSKCLRGYPAFYHGKNTTLMLQIPLFSELSSIQQEMFRAKYEHVLAETERRDKHRVFPRSTVTKRSECDGFWSQYLVRHVDVWEDANLKSKQQQKQKQQKQQEINGRKKINPKRKFRKQPPTKQQALKEKANRS